MKLKLDIAKRLGFFTLAVAIVSLLFIAAPVTAAPLPVTITLLSGGTTQTAGYIYVNPFPQQLNPTVYNGGGTWVSAPVITSQPGPWVQIPPAQWVSTTAAFSGSDANYTGDSWRLFQDQFTIPAGATITAASIQVAADNAFEIYLNGNLIDSTATWVPSATIFGVSPVPFGPATPYTNTVTYSVTPQIGINTFMFVVRNWSIGGGNNPTGLLYSASITYTAVPQSIGGTVYETDKIQMLLPWLGVGLGALLVLPISINRLFFRKKQRYPNR